MPYFIKDRVQFGSSTEGTGSFVLDVPLNKKEHQNFTSNTSFRYDYDNRIVIEDYDFYYTATDGGANWEVGIGKYSNGPVIEPSYITLSFQPDTYGAVLAPNGDVHYISHSGQFPFKISSAGVVSTYSVVYSTSNGYYGGVLAQNGDIHFVPYKARVGQKVSSAGVVSTYSLAYTTTNAYFGGVLAQNGDVHFVPYSASVGQKVSAAGVVSTYSLVYTAVGAYAGGVLAPNGDIHFIQEGAEAGQKISASGVVSTYSVLYTSYPSYGGGVLAPNGDIHFVPYSVPFGQKISTITGVVSSYTINNPFIDLYYGGLLASNGDIHFIPYSTLGKVGQKISVNGTVTTYPTNFPYNLSSFSPSAPVLDSRGDALILQYDKIIRFKLSEPSPSIQRVEVLESSNSNSLVNFTRGRKNIFVTLAANTTQGAIATADDSSIGTNLVAWNNLKKELQKGVTRGSPFSNLGGYNTRNKVIASTYSLVYTEVSGYNGGVIAPNGDIHFVPFAGNRGQKINYKTNVVSTYALVYTTADGAYNGGVLAPNGDIHFVPYAANRGQKVSASGIVSTYSLIYTGFSLYSGGVLAPNGDVHFVPFYAERGQKISAAGVVSTYSLVYTDVNGAYAAGVLAPNGDIHFIPSNANRGQKISAAGVVSTYSLVYTAGGYIGGVLAPNGDIYFIPNLHGIGQKISISGVVSTFTLDGSNLFNYGISPSGDIYRFDSSVGALGYKIDTRSNTSSAIGFPGYESYQFIGMVLDPNGDFHLVPYSTDRGVKLSTGTKVPLAYCLSPFYNKY